jgi:hypothetical protein
MFGHARRLKAIADANKPAFASTPGTEWWLAETPSHIEPSDTAPPAPSAAPPARPVDADPPMRFSWMSPAPTA